MSHIRLHYVSADRPHSCHLLPNFSQNQPLSPLPSRFVGVQFQKGTQGVVAYEKRAIAKAGILAAREECSMGHPFYGTTHSGIGWVVDLPDLDD